jgi:hypothetical protein
MIIIIKHFSEMCVFYGLLRSQWFGLYSVEWQDLASDTN